MAKISVQAQLDEFFYRELLQYLKLAEQKRRWNVFNDIPWDQANPDTSDTLAHCVETFCAVEMYLPDFTASLLRMIRRGRGRSWFHVNWGYEESKHSMALEAWLLASGHRTEEQRDVFVRELLEAEWELPFDHPRQMICYTMIQELATFWNYRNLEKIAAKEGDWALVSALRVISVDERVHYHFYRNAVKEWMRHDEAGTVEDLKYVFDNFTMPGKSQIPRYDESARILAKTGIYGPREYIKLVKNPVLEDLKLDKDFHKMEAEEARDNAKRAEEAARLQREQVGVSSNGSAIPKNGTAFSGHPHVHGSQDANGSGSGKPGTPFNSHAIASALKNTRRDAAPEEQEPLDEEAHATRKSPFLEIIGVEPKERTPSRSVIMASEAREEKLPGSRGMPNYDNLDQQLMAAGDELSNHPEELRRERQDIRRNRVKNDKLMRQGE